MISRRNKKNYSIFSPNDIQDRGFGGPLLQIFRDIPPQKWPKYFEKDKKFWKYLESKRLKNIMRFEK